MEQKRNWLSTVGGRKFLGFLIATVALFFGRFDPEWWVVAYAIYVGGNVSQKIGLLREGGHTNVDENTEPR